MSVNDAVRAWREWIEPTKDYKSLMYFGSPSVTNSGDADKGLNWLRDFLNQCSGCKIDFLCIHWSVPYPSHPTPFPSCHSPFSSNY